MEQGINEAYKFLKDCGTYYLATVKDGLPALRPFGTVNIYQDKLYIQTSSKKEVYQEMIQNHMSRFVVLKMESGLEYRQKLFMIMIMKRKNLF